MKTIEPGIRNGVRAIILRGEKLLVLKKYSADYGDRYALPGGSQDLGETLETALQRECVEEIGTPVTIGDLIHVADYFKPRGTQPLTFRHKVEFLFRCTVPSAYQPILGPKPDKHQTGVEWISLNSLAAGPFAPKGMVPAICGHATKPLPLYLGEVE